MTVQMKRSATLLVFLGILLSLPLAVKTGSAHGAIPALVTGLLVMVAVILGPLSYVVASVVESYLTIVTQSASKFEFALALTMGLLLLLAWKMSMARRPDQSMPYLPVTGWALMGAYFCLSQVFPHITQ